MEDDPAFIDKAMADFRERFVEASAQIRTATSPEAFAACERQLHQLSKAVADEVTTLALQAMCDDMDRVRTAAVEVRATAASRGIRMISEGRRNTRVRLLGGRTVTIHASYLRAKPWAKAPLETRGKDGTGVYPVLDQLGITDFATPALRLHVAHAVCEANSVADARELMAQAGLDIDHKTALRLTYAVTKVALSVRRVAVRQTTEGNPQGELRGRRVVVCVDGGRTKIRKALPGRPRKGGRRRFESDWREPKVICVYALDDAGELDVRTRRVLDGTLGDADATFDLMVYHLRHLGAHLAEQLILLADGAKWIWNRANDLVTRLGIDSDRVVQIVDHFHAAQRLHEFAKSRGWSEARQRRWVRKQKRRLKRGWVSRIVADIKPHLTGDEVKSGTQVAYWARNLDRLRYRQFRKMRVPIGSGAVESAVRRVVNMRLKGPGIFWREDHAEGLIHLRAASKAGRWDELEGRVFANSHWRPSSRRKVA